MDRRDELEQQIWEFVYDLLPEDEAAAVRRRIAAESEVARLHDEVRRQVALLAEAAKLELPPIPLPHPDAEDAAPAHDAPMPASTVAKPAARSARRWVNWAVGLAASGLLCYLGWASFQTGWPGRSVVRGSPAATLADQPVRAVLIGPQELQPTLTNYVAVQTQNAAGDPVAAIVDYRWYGDDGTAVDSGQCQTDASGFTQLALAKPLRSDAVHLEVEPQTALKNVSVRCSIPVAASELTTYLTTDKTIYRPGEQVRFRTVTLDRADLQVHREVPVALRVVNEDGDEVNGLGGRVTTRRGVGFGDFELPRFQPPGKQTLIAASPAGDFPEARREFEVRPYRTPALRQTLDFVRDSYAPGDEVEAELRVELADGKPARNVPLAVTAESRARKFFNLHTTTNDQGSYRVRFNLPAEVDPGQALLNVTAGKDVQDQISERIPVHQGEVTVEFFPESGELVPDVDNRVYFFAHDSLDRPVHVRGRVVDREGRPVAELQTVRDGRGAFALRPARNERYRLLIDQPAGVPDRPELPPASGRQFATINAGGGVFAAGAPIRVKLVSQDDRPVAVVAVCRGVVVGQELVSPTAFRSDKKAGGPEIAVPVAETAEGVIRLTVYDYSVQPPPPVAERLVYRRPTRKLAIQPAPAQTDYLPGDAVNVAVSVQDERGQPQTAVLGASVVDEAALSLVRDRSASLTTHFWLMGQIDDVRGLEDANFYLSDGSEAEQALDLLLGTQGWRRFTTVPVDQLAQSVVAGQPDQDAFAYQVPADVVAVSEPTAPTVLADNAEEVSRILSSGLDSLRVAAAPTVQRVGRVLIVGSLILATVLALLAAMRRLPATTVWLPALGTSAMCLVLGCVWLVTHSEPSPEFAKVAWDESVAEQQLAQADKRLAAASQPETAVSSELATSEGELATSEGKEAKGHEVLAEKDKKSQTAVADQYRRQLEVADKPADARQTPLRQLSRVGDAVTRQLAEPPAASPEPLAELKNAQAGAASPSRALSRESRTKAGLEAVPSVAAPMAAAAPAQPLAAAEMPAAARPSAAAKEAHPAAPALGFGAKRAEKKAGQLHFGKAAERAGGMMPGMAAQSAPAATPSMGGGYGGVGGPVASDAVGDREGQGQRRVGGWPEAAEHGMMPGGVARPSAVELADQPASRAAIPDKPPTDSRASLTADSLAASRTQLCREYARRGRSGPATDGRTPRVETLFWEPLLETDARGQAGLKFKLPDTATTYRVLIDGHAAGRIGSYSGRIVVQPAAAP